MFNGRRQPSRGGTSRMSREAQVRICEGLGVKLPGPTRQKHACRRPGQEGGSNPVSAPEKPARSRWCKSTAMKE